VKQLLILSGKGGTGKTTVASAFIKLADARAYADCDVDAPNLHLVTEWATDPTKRDYYGLPVAKLTPELCTHCDLCRQHCRFGAISDGDQYSVDPYGCEGCGVCAYICPAQAIEMVPAVAGELMLYADEEKVFSTAQLRMGSGTSGLLVTEVKKEMKEVAHGIKPAVEVVYDNSKPAIKTAKDGKPAIEAAHDSKTVTNAASDGKPVIEVDYGSEVAIIDGSPGIGCPVIASLSGVDMVLIVAEPSLSGLSDMERIIRTAEGFDTKIAVCTNKYDMNLEISEKIEQFCEERGLPFAGRIPFDPAAVRAVNNAKTIVDVECPSGTAVTDIFKKTMTLLFD
jgi:MinD superfamily P-loop ATPase